MKVDFHCHSNCSDGELSPLELIKLAKKNNVSILSITDHDTLDAYKSLSYNGIKLVTGVEFSTCWNKINIHIVGLNIPLEDARILELVNAQKTSREIRAKIISKKLQKYSSCDLHLELKKMHPEKQLGRPDFASILVKKGICKDSNQAFKKYLGAGKIGDVKNQWACFEHIINTIVNVGGIAVLAHPLYYKLTNTKLRYLLTDFKKAGGEGFEVVNGYQNPDKTDYLKKLCNEFNFKASIGSDFHYSNSFKSLGCDTRLIANLPNVWESVIA